MFEALTMFGKKPALRDFCFLPSTNFGLDAVYTSVERPLLICIAHDILRSTGDLFVDLHVLELCSRNRFLRFPVEPIYGSLFSLRSVYTYHILQSYQKQDQS